MKKGLIIGGSLFGAAVIGAAGFFGYKYIEGREQYSTHFYNGIHYSIMQPDGETLIAEGSLNEMTVDEAMAVINGQLDDYTLLIKGYTGTEERITASQIRMGTIEDPEELLVKTLKEQDADHWYRYATDLETAFRECELVLHYTYDQQALVKTINSLQAIAPDQPVESSESQLVYNEDTLLYEYIPSSVGNIGDPQVITPLVEDAVYHMETELYLDEDMYLQPDRSNDDFYQEREAAINQYLQASITLQDGDKEIVVDKSVIIDLLDITEDYEVTLVTKKLQDYINKTIDPFFKTVGIERTIETPSSGTINISGGTFGKMVRTLSEVEQLTKEITGGETVTREPKYYDNYITTSDNAEVGDTYIDINISKQMVYVVQNGEITFETACVTGLDNEERRTPTGVYYVIRKVRDYTMVKYDAFVSYWMPISDSTGVGLHDASWRGSFGGSIYKSNGSHGCINLPSEAAKTIYNMIDKGMTVIVHY